MKQYDLYGIGNALVDKEFVIDDNFLTSHGIDKGLMTLVDAGPQQHLIDELTTRFGLQKRASGGSAANSMIAAANFGGHCYYACKVGADEPGDFYLHDLAQARVANNTNGSRTADSITGRCVVMVTPDAERTMLSHLGISSSLSTSDLDFDALRSSKYLYLEGYLVTSESTRQAAIHAREFAEQNGVKTSLTFSDPNMVTHFRPGIEAMLGAGVDMLFCNAEEARLFSGHDDIEAAARTLRDCAHQFAVTCGAQGALVWDGRQLHRIDSVQVQAVDTNGAGDMFAGAFLYALTQGQSIQQAGKLASLSAATLVTEYGPRLTAAVQRRLLEQATAL
ncbi:MAG: adenosine kinase [Pseudomonadota bacterium]|nr:adenosine kinase [Pseudomonadota bacterium]